MSRPCLGSWGSWRHRSSSNRSEVWLESAWCLRAVVFRRRVHLYWVTGRHSSDSRDVIIPSWYRNSRPPQQLNSNAQPQRVMTRAATTPPPTPLPACPHSNESYVECHCLVVYLQQRTPWLFLHITTTKKYCSLWFPTAPVCACLYSMHQLQHHSSSVAAAGSCTGLNRRMQPLLLPRSTALRPVSSLHGAQHARSVAAISREQHWTPKNHLWWPVSSSRGSSTRTAAISRDLPAEGAGRVVLPKLWSGPQVDWSRYHLQILFVDHSDQLRAKLAAAFFEQVGCGGVSVF